MIYLRFCQFWENYNKRLKLLAECVFFFLCTEYREIGIYGMQDK